jgi:hypothetical protein
MQGFAELSSVRWSREVSAVVRPNAKPDVKRWKAWTSGLKRCSWSAGPQREEVTVPDEKKPKLGNGAALVKSRLARLPIDGHESIVSESRLTLPSGG